MSDKRKTNKKIIDILYENCCPICHSNLIVTEDQVFCLNSPSHEIPQTKIDELINKKYLTFKNNLIW